MRLNTCQVYFIVKQLVLLEHDSSEYAVYFLVLLDEQICHVLSCVVFV